jgi:potassium/chloride transporter 4/5/6
MDIWWIIHDGGLLMLFTYLLSLHSVWRNCQLRVFVISEVSDNNEEIKHNIQVWFTRQRMNVLVEIVDVDDESIGMYTYDYTIKIKDRN